MLRFYRKCFKTSFKLILITKPSNGFPMNFLKQHRGTLISLIMTTIAYTVFMMTQALF